RPPPAPSRRPADLPALIARAPCRAVLSPPMVLVNLLPVAVHFVLIETLCRWRARRARRIRAPAHRWRCRRAWRPRRRHRGARVADGGGARRVGRRAPGASDVARAAAGRGERGGGARRARRRGAGAGRRGGALGGARRPAGGGARRERAHGAPRCVQGLLVLRDLGLGGGLACRVDVRRDAGDARQLLVYAPYWLSNRTGLTLATDDAQLPVVADGASGALTSSTALALSGRARRLCVAVLDG